MLSVPTLASSYGSGCARSLLALLLSAPSQEVARDPPYRVRGSPYRIRDSAYRIRDSAYRSRRGCLEDDDFVVLHARYRSASGLRHPTTYTSRGFVRGPQRFFTLPEGYTAHPAACSVTEGDEPLESVHLLELWQDLLLEVACGVVHPVWRGLHRGQPGMHAVTPSSHPIPVG